MDWQSVRSPEDVERLLERFGSFHDGCLREFHVWSDWYVQEDLSATRTTEVGTTARMLFQRQWSNPSAIEMLFEGVKGMHLAPVPVNYDPLIFDATLELRADGMFYWSDTWNTVQEEHGNWITASALSWRDASEWMGEHLRYGVGRLAP